MHDGQARILFGTSTGRISEVEKQLKEAEMKAIAYSTMIEIAEKEFNISIKKNQHL